MKVINGIPYTADELLENVIFDAEVLLARLNQYKPDDGSLLDKMYEIHIISILCLIADFRTCVGDEDEGV